MPNHEYVRDVAGGGRIVNAEFGPTTEFDPIGDTDVVARTADATWSIASVRDGPEFRLILRGPVDAGTTSTVLDRLDEVLDAGERIVTLDVRGLRATHARVTALLGEAQSHAADHSGLVVAVGLRPDATPAHPPIGDERDER